MLCLCLHAMGLGTVLSVGSPHFGIAHSPIQIIVVTHVKTQENRLEAQKMLQAGVIRIKRVGSVN